MIEMMNLEDAKKLGANKCISLFDSEFIKKNKDNLIACFNCNDNGFIDVWVGVPAESSDKDQLILTNKEGKYYALVRVDRNTERTEVIKTQLPN